jgi:uncharacterized protein YfdQ (DUF2303 family)
MKQETVQLATSELINTIKTLHQPQIKTFKPDQGEIDRVATLAIVPNGMTVEDLSPYIDELRERPGRKKGEAQFSEIPSFIEHVNQFKTPASRLFASMGNVSLKAVFDYNTPGQSDWGEHRAAFTAPLSEQWKKWTARNDKPFETQEEFAEFIEDRIIDLVEGDPGKSRKVQEFIEKAHVTLGTPNQVMNLSRGLKVRINSTVANVVNTSSGESEFVFSEEHKDATGNKLTVPGGFVIAIPVFEESTVLYLIPVRLRYRVRGGSVCWWYSMWQHQDVFRMAFREACEKASGETELPLFYGSPERG